MHLRVMLIRLLLGWGLAASPGLLFAQTPPEQMDAYIALVRAEASMRDGDTRQAMGEMETALELYQKIADGYPGWNPEVIAYRITYCRNALTRLQHPDPAPLEEMEPRQEPVPSAPSATAEDGRESVPDPRLTELEQVIQSLTEERERTQEEVDALRKQVEEQARAQEKEADKAMKSLERELSDARKATTRLQQTVADLEAEKREWTEARDGLVATHDEAVKAWRTEKKSMAHDAKEADRESQRMSKEIALLQAQLTERVEREEKLRAEIALLKENHRRAVGNLEGQVTELRELAVETEQTHQALVRDLEASLASAQSGEASPEDKEAGRQIAYWQEHARALQETVDLQAAELSQSARRELRELSRENRELRARISVLEMGRQAITIEPTDP